MAQKKQRYFGTIEKLKTGWRMRVTVGYAANGTPTRIPRFTSTKNAAEREKELMRFIDELQKNGYVAPQNLVLREFVENEWLPKYASSQLSYDTMHDYHEHLKRRIYPVLGGVQISKITTLQIVNLIDGLQKSGKRLEDKSNNRGIKEKPLSAHSIRNIYYALNSVLSVALKWQVISSNPAKGVSLPSRKKRVPTIYQGDTLERMYEVLKKEPLQMQIMIYIAVVAGCREAELVALEAKHIDFKENRILFEQTIVDVVGEGVTVVLDTKNSVEGWVDIPQWLTDLITEYLTLTEPGTGEWAGYHFLFADETGKPKRPDSVYQRWVRFTKRYNLPHIRFHDLRHTSASLLISKGEPIKVVQERLRHKSMITTADTYAHILQETHRKAADSFEKPF
ncbi:site-specific integrase [Listeria monocytogenes]|nr:site-specific integrase [Listeria monocytogenes]HBJ8545850.1 site-specific integrase [Listeria monocytogenes]HBJ8604313.1 site-specific integrase [Listeria monocytogenes]HEL8334672.1 site-specific integrase [Listeria monocytogenes]